MVFDPLYFILVGPAMILGIWAQWRVKSAFHRGAEITARSNITGAETAQMILDAHGYKDVRLEMAEGVLSDHYDPRAKVVRLSHDVYHGHSLSALGIAAHEVGHVIQDKTRYAPLAIRNGIVPLASIGGNFSMLVFIIGLSLSAAGMVFGQWMVMGAIALFTLFVAFQLINLPVEFDASNRAKKWLATSGLVSADEAPVVRSVLNAAAWTYVAATLSAVLTLVYLLIRANQSRD
ncbi:MAG: zinc metallopeptidase [Phycisphaerales bacterium]